MSSNELIYYHNPRCSKSRQGLALLEEREVHFHIKEYLKEELSEDEVLDLSEKLQKEPSEFIRAKEKVYTELGLGNKELSKKDWVKVIVENPILLERPILRSETKAQIGRPPEDLLTLL